tara:strand:+ start:1047 stop:2168 length:1122 start_codon:yes stop_codon:yes gene_type:complete
MKVPSTKPFFSEEDQEFILERYKDILAGNSFLSMYKYGEEFENSFAEYIGTNNAVGCNSGTSALELIFESIDVKGKEVIVPSNTFLATVIAIRNAGGIPVFADCNDQMCLDFESTIKQVSPRTKAICIVHIGGIVSDSVIPLKSYCEKNRISLVEDAAQAHGSSLQGTKAGNFGIAAAFSFFSTKVMTTGEGGMVTTNSSELVKKMKSMREFGKVKTDIYINYHKYFGYNWRLPEVSALMGIRQLNSLDKFIKRRQEIARIYDDAFENCEGIRVINPSEKSSHNYFKYIIILEKSDRKKMHKFLQENQISPSGYVYELPLHKQPVLSEHSKLSFPNTEILCANHICLPIFYSMTNEQVNYVSKIVKQYFLDNK